jgi:hypothetical protein
MSGPIVRRYGFANFEKIFGERELQHGNADAEPKPASPAEPPIATPAQTPPKTEDERPKP